jgi:signal transduction histidine kinase
VYERTEKYEKAIAYYSAALNGSFCDWDRIRQSEITNKMIQLSAKQEARIASEQRSSERKTLGLVLSGVLLILISLIGTLLYRARGQALKIAESEVDELLHEQELKSVESMFIGQERERKRIAEELHDRLGGMLSTLKLHYSSVERQITELSESVTDQYIKARDIIDETAEEVRRISHDLYSGTLVDYGLIAAIEQLEETLENVGGPDFFWDLNNMDQRLDSELEINLYRIIQEGVSNILKHAQAQKVTVQLTRYQDSADLVIEDDGRGFDTKQDAKGIGLKNLNSRVERLNGQLTIDSARGRGTILIIQIPLST